MQKEKTPETICFKFESGTTLDDMFEYAEKIRQKFKGHMAEDELNKLVDSFLVGLNNVQTLCDSCKNTITDQEKNKLNNKINFMCRLCSTKYDLCEKCQKEEATSNCPNGFGCAIDEYNYNEKSEDDDQKEIFIHTQDNRNVKTYNIYGQTFYVPPEKKFSVDSSVLLKEFETSKTYPLAAVYFDISPSITISDDMLRDLWLYFRTTEDAALKRYGPPSKSITSIGNLRLYNDYTKIKEIFQKFIDVDSKIEKESTLSLLVEYPNHVFMIRRLCTEEKEKMNMTFLTNMLPLSNKGNNEKSMYSTLLDHFKNKVENDSKKSIKDLQKSGQILFFVILTNSERKI